MYSTQANPITHTVQERAEKVFPVIDSFRKMCKSSTGCTVTTQTVRCPMCGASFTMEYNGSFETVNARCSKEGCVTWSE